MRIAVIHSFYRSAVSSGENNTVLAQVEALRGAGHEVKLVAQYTDENRKGNPFYPLKAGFDVATGNGYDPTEELQGFRPDILRVHNLFPNFGTKWLAKWEGPIMATLHNYRPVCANGVLFRDGAICTLCPDGKPSSALKYGCYKDSRLASLPLTIQISKGLDANPLLVRADKIVVLSERSCDAYVRFGLDPSRLVIIPNFVPPLTPISSSQSPVDRWVVASRLTPEKGVFELVRMWPSNYDLDIYGNGHERSSIAVAANPKIGVYERIEQIQLANILPRYTGMVFPSRVWENVPGAVLMAFGAGLPVVAREDSVGADLVTKYEAGKTFFDAKSLEAALMQVVQNRKLYSRNAALAYELNFTDASWLKRTEQELDALVPLRVT